MSDTQNAAAPGWYPDTKDTSLYRYWDGSRWTDDTHPASMFQKSSTGTTTKMYSAVADAAAGTNTPAVIGLIGGIACFLINPFALIGIAGIVWSSIGLSRASAYQHRGRPAKGRTQATWGLVLSIIGTVLFLGVRLPTGFFFV